MLECFAKIRLLPRLAWIAFVASACLALVSAFQWSIVDLVTPFLMLPLQGIVWLIFLAVCVWSLVHFLRNRKQRRALLPAIICAVAFGLVTVIPFTDLWLRFNFASNKSAREHVVRDIAEGRLAPTKGYGQAGSLIDLPQDAPYVSNGGNEIETETHAGKTYVLFYTFRGILSSYAGFLYVPTGGDPSAFSDLNEQRQTIIERYDNHWFFVSHRN